MQIGGIQLFQALGEKMRWHQERQGVLAENIANADTPGFMERDLKAFSFGDEMTSMANLTMSASSPMHVQATSGGGRFGDLSAPLFAVYNSSGSSGGPSHSSKP